ncbi:MAG TPA: hypothetical protein VN638_12645, partial [Nitrospiraceae bacterium]|nr:hypothetical protein [Nitrospiraceae bacterium]
EVAPSQFESAPIFEEANIATDHNQLVMEVLRKVALRHNFSVLLHEKPFEGINGSGKHNNWSMSITGSGPEQDGDNLLDPGKTPHQNLRFLLVLAGVMKGVYAHAGLLRASIASAGNDHRLGANEAPPAIISIFLGDMLNRILDEIEQGTTQGQNPEAAVLKLGVSKLPEVMKDNADRNRTSPFAFTGNKFEFRAVGSSASTAFPVTILNAAVADGFTEIIESLKARLRTSNTVESAVLEVVKEAIQDTHPIRFEGNNYSEDWVSEAERRGIPNLRKTPEALAELSKPKSKAMLAKMGIFTEAELVSRFHVRTERYVKNLLIEIDTLCSMVETQILPAAYAYHGMLAAAVLNCKSLGTTAPQADVLIRLGGLIVSLQTKRTVLEASLHKIEGLSSEEEKAVLLAHDITLAMSDVRQVCDELESIVADDYWPLPKYREMLFLS